MTRHAIAARIPFLLLLGTLASGLGPGRAFAQVSPGPLSSAHASLEGTSNCLQCHGPRGSKAGMDEKCLACHKEVAWMRGAKRGFHATVADRNCASCHPDHGGRDFALVAWDGGSPEKFDHRRAGFALEGKHATLECVKCHTPALQKSPAAALVRKKDRSKSWMGLQTACADCHRDVHRGQLGTDCRSCHGQDAWKPAPGFDHAKSRFPLTGRHEKVECLKCHAAPPFVKERDAKGQPLPEWKPLPHADCVSCHKDPHQGRFKGACAKCHGTTDWKVMNRGGFDHDQTRYPLRGRHASLRCEQCHDPKVPGSQKPKFALCTDCHRDAHAGTAKRSGQVVDCASCHVVAGWKPSTYTAADHAKSAYPLEGAHARATCGLCHVHATSTPASLASFGRALVTMRPKRSACTDCHADPHAGRFRPGGPRGKADDCLACHGLEQWSPSRYDAKMHDTSTFKLEGAHVAVPCVACHAELKAKPSANSLPAAAATLRPLRFAIGKRACADCHRNPHGDQFAHRRDQGACEGCHDSMAFSPASRFDHDRDSKYRLEGAHRRTPCAGCHPSKIGADGKPFTVYRPLATRCEGCHLAGVPSPLDSLSTPVKSSLLLPEHLPLRGTPNRPIPEASHVRRS